MAKSIVVCGYPKSGNTFAARLIAEVIGCPAAGFFQAPGHEDVVIEGLERKSEYVVYKAHQGPIKLYGGKPDFVAYVVRDVRDVVCSGAHYFNLPAYNEFRRNAGLREVDRYWAMINTVLYGGVYAHCSKPWGLHVNEYRSRNAHLIHYESLLGDPYVTIGKLLDALGEWRSREAIDQAVTNQSFEKRKEQFKESGDGRNVRFLRKGKAGSYQEELSDKQIGILNEEYAPLLGDLGYLELEQA